MTTKHLGNNNFTKYVLPILYTGGDAIAPFIMNEFYVFYGIQSR